MYRFMISEIVTMNAIYNVLLNKDDLTGYGDNYLLGQIDMEQLIRDTTKNGVIDGDAVIREIFKNDYEYDVFISYSHKIL